MKATIQIRNKLGLTQSEMAQYLSITRSRLSLYEIGKRDLPTSALIKLAEITLFLHRPPAKKNKARPHEKPQLARAALLLEKQAKELAWQQELTRRKLAATQKKYAQKMLLLDLLDHLKAYQKSAAGANIHSAWLNMMEAEANKYIQQNGLDKQALLKIKLKNLQP